MDDTTATVHDTPAINPSAGTPATTQAVPRGTRKAKRTATKGKPRKTPAKRRAAPAKRARAAKTPRKQAKRGAKTAPKRARKTAAVPRVRRSAADLADIGNRIVAYLRAHPGAAAVDVAAACATTLAGLRTVWPGLKEANRVRSEGAKVHTVYFAVA